MCGRFSLRATPDEIARALGVAPPREYRPRYNVAPGQEVLAILADRGGAPQPRLLRWGLVPFWADDPRIGSRMINARAETVASKPAFRAAFAQRRCIVVADGFYEWQRRPDGKHPMRVRCRPERPMALAGLWERWGRGRYPLETCAILTTGPNELMAAIHDRMPVILDAEGVQRWLDPAAAPEELAPLLRPCPPGELEAYEVSTLVNSPSNDRPECLEAVAGEVPPPAPE